MTILRNCRLVPYLTEGFESPMADIVIDGKYIREISPCEKYDNSYADTIDIGGKTVLPGFFDLHAHLMYKNNNWEYLIRRPQNTYLMECAGYAKTYLKLGFTTVRDVGSDYYSAVTIRDYINSGLLTGARVVAAGKILTPTTRGNSSFGPLYKEVDSAEGLLKAVREDYSAGVDLIKYMCTGAVLNVGGEPGQLVTTFEELQAVVRAAESVGTYVAAHCHGTKGINLAIKAGVMSIEHASYMDEESVELILKNGKKTFIVPTLSGSYHAVYYPEDYLLPEFRRKCTDALDHMGESVKMSLAAGIQIGFGTDFAEELNMKYPGLEFTARAKYGIPNEDILKQATINSAQILKMDDRLGTIREGKYADIVVIDGKPDEDITCMQKCPDMVFKEGVRYID